jgi:hypothetical protein
MSTQPLLSIQGDTFLLITSNLTLDFLDSFLAAYCFGLHNIKISCFLSRILVLIRLEFDAEIKKDTYRGPQLGP